MAGSERADNALHRQLSTDPLSPVERWRRAEGASALPSGEIRHNITQRARVFFLFVCFFSSSKSSWEFSFKKIIHFETVISFLLTGADGFVVFVVLVRFVSTGLI